MGTGKTTGSCQPLGYPRPAPKLQQDGLLPTEAPVDTGQASKTGRNKDSGASVCVVRGSKPLHRSPSWLAPRRGCPGVFSHHLFVRGHVLHEGWVGRDYQEDSLRCRYGDKSHLDCGMRILIQSLERELCWMGLRG